MNRLNKAVLVAFAGLYCILSILPIQHCSSTNELFIYDCPKSSFIEELSSTEERKSCCNTEPCCGEYIQINEENSPFINFMAEEDKVKSLISLELLYQQNSSSKIIEELYVRKKPRLSGFISTSRYILLESFLC